MGAAGFGDRSDNPETHYNDTMQAARGFIDPVLVRTLAEDAPERIRDLVALGVQLDREADNIKLIRNDYNTYARAVSVQGKTGKVFVHALSDEISRLGVDIDSNVALIDLVLDRDGAVAGVLGYDSVNRVIMHYEAPSIIMGTGGMHGAFQQQVSTAEMTGDGQAICFRHGAEMVNLEFHQFGPALIHPYVQLFSGSCFRLHPKLINSKGEEFLGKYVPRGVDIAKVYDEKGFRFTTSNVSRYLDIAMSREIAAGRGTQRNAIYFSFIHVSQEKLDALMPNTARWMREHNLDLRREKLEVGIAFQCMNGGVRMTGPDAQSTIPGLFVIGELAGGVRGPDRPGGNSLAEGQVFGHRSGKAAAERAIGCKAGEAYTLDATIGYLAEIMARKPGNLDVQQSAREVQKLMQQNCLVEKTGDSLKQTLETVLRVKGEFEKDLALTPESLIEGLGVRNLVQASELVLRACLNREETRSGHYRLDHPERDDVNYPHSFVLKRSDSGIVMTPHKY